MSAIQVISHQSWTCPICYELMDGQNDDGAVSIIKRCQHVFHDVYIRNAIDRSRRACPTCNLANLRSAEILPNPSYGEECRRWQEDPENFDLDEDRLKPPELIGVPREREFDIYEYPERILELNAEAIRICDHEPHTPENAEKIRKLNQEQRELQQKCWNQALPERIDKVGQDFRDLRQDWQQIGEDQRGLLADFQGLNQDWQQIRAHQDVIKQQLDEVMERSGLNSRFHPQRIWANTLRQREAALQAAQNQMPIEEENVNNNPPKDLYVIKTIAKVVGIFILIFGIIKIKNYFSSNKT